MPTRTYNRFTQWVQQDDYLTNWPNFIEHKNIDGLRDGYGLHLWPKVNKGIITTGIINSIEFERASNPIDLDESLIWWGRFLYRLDSPDSTPAYTFTDADVEIRQIVFLGSYWYIVYQQLSGNARIARVSGADVSNGTFTSMDEAYVTNIWTTVRLSLPYIIIGTSIYFWIAGSIAVFDWTPTLTSFWFPDDLIKGMSLRGTTIMVYTRSGNIYQWDWTSSTYSSLTNIWTPICNVSSWAIYDFIHTYDGQLFIWQWLSVQALTYPKKSKRWDDNSVYKTRLSFWLLDEEHQNTIWVTALNDMYIFSNDSDPWIYKYGKLNTQMQSWFHKAITENHEWTQIDVIYDMRFHERGSRFLYFSYKAGSTYWVDYIDLDSLETTTDWYAITEVFAWNTPSYEKTIKQLIRSSSNTSGSNYIQIHYRVNNGSWVLVENINDATDIITSREIAKDSTGQAFNENIDVQLKISLHNDDWWEDSPTLHELIYEYNLK